MAYIGVSPSNGVRRVFDYTATAGQTSFSGSDNNSQTLAYTDSAYIDVYQNGVLLIPSDYTATTGTTVVLDTGATVSDTVQIVAYDVFSVADTVSASDGGSFGGNVGVGGTLSVTGATKLSDKLGIGATTIDSDIHIEKSSDLQIKLERTGSGTSTISVPSSGQLELNNTSNAAITFSTNNTERARITPSGYLNVGTTSENALFFVEGSENPNVRVHHTQNADEINVILQHAYAQSSQTATMIQFRDSGGSERGTIKTSGSATAYNTSSDYRLKENVTYDFDATSRLKQLKPARFNFIVDADNTVDGFLAHEVSSIVPEAISGEKDAVNEDGSIKPQGIDQSKLVPLLVKTIQELEARITALESK